MPLLRTFFAKLDEWRHMPAYQLERHVDVFVGLFLPELIEKKFHESGGVVVPEFPLHKGNLGVDQDFDQKENNQSINVDFAVFCKSEEIRRIFLVELKTESKSIRTEQLCNMRKAQHVGSEAVLGGVLKAANSSDEKPKYAHLLYKLHNVGCVERKHKEKGAKDFDQINMDDRSPGLAPTFRDLEVSEDWKEATLDLALIAPQISFKSQSTDFSNFFLITLDEVANVIEEECYSRLQLSRYLREWERTKAGRAQLGSKSLEFHNFD